MQLECHGCLAAANACGSNAVCFTACIRLHLCTPTYALKGQCAAQVLGCYVACSSSKTSITACSHLHVCSQCFGLILVKRPPSSL